MKVVRAFILVAGVVAVATLIPHEAFAGFFETSIGGSYNKSDFDHGSYSRTKRYGGSVGYNFSDSSSIEFGFQNSREETHYEGYQDSVYKDQVYSLTWIQNFAPKGSRIQPYTKLGIGQLNREATTVLLASGQSQVTEVDSVTGVVGAGLRIFLSQAFALRFEGTSYLVGGKLKTWNENFGLTAGGSLYF